MVSTMPKPTASPLFVVPIVWAFLGSMGPFASADDWPHWRGPTHDGVSRETDWTTDWGSEGPKQVWKTNVGTGFSSFAVADGLLYTAGHLGGLDTVVCLSAETGKPIWHYTYAAPLVDNLHEGGPAATPTVDGERVYTLSKDGQLYCLHAQTGNVLWSQGITPLTGVAMPQWGFSCSALVHENMLVLEVGCTVALDKRTGELIWKTAPYNPGYGSPAPCTVDGSACVAVLNNEALLLVRLSDGKVLASHAWTTDYDTSSTTPIVVGDTVFISTGYKRGCALLKLNGDKFDVVYENRSMSNHMANCVLEGGCLYGFDGNSHNSRLVSLVCMDYATGDVKWSQRGLGCGSIMLAGGKLLALSDEGELACIAADPSGYHEIARAKVIDGRCWTVPVLAGGRVYCRTAAGDVVCVDLRTSSGL
jgi:outer membrane protein assembly factor BamB